MRRAVFCAEKRPCADSERAQRGKANEGASAKIHALRSIVNCKPFKNYRTRPNWPAGAVSFGPTKGAGDESTKLIPSSETKFSRPCTCCDISFILASWHFLFT